MNVPHSARDGARSRPLRPDSLEEALRDSEVRAGLGAVLKRRRKAAGLTLEQLSERAGPKTSSLSDIERGNRGTSAGTFLAITQALDCDPDEVLDEAVIEGRRLAAVRMPRIDSGPRWARADFEPLPDDTFTDLSALVGQFGPTDAAAEARFVPVPGARVDINAPSDRVAGLLMPRCQADANEHVTAGKSDGLDRAQAACGGVGVTFKRDASDAQWNRRKDPWTGFAVAGHLRARFSLKCDVVRSTSSGLPGWDFHWETGFAEGGDNLVVRDYEAHQRVVATSDRTCTVYFDQQVKADARVLEQVAVGAAGGYMLWYAAQTFLQRVKEDAEGPRSATAAA